MVRGGGEKVRRMEAKDWKDCSRKVYIQNLRRGGVLKGEGCEKGKDVRSGGM